MDFNAMFQTWIRVLTNPSEPTFESEKASDNATLTTAMIWIVIAAVVTAVLGFLQSLLFAGTAASSMQQFIDMADLPPEVASQMEMLVSGGGMTALSGVGSFASIILTPIFFLFSVGIFHLLATVLGGRGDFGKYAYLTATFQAPVSIIGGLLAFVPVVGACVGVLVSVYSVVLLFFATKVNYNLSAGRTVVAIILPLILIFVVALCFGLLVAGAVISAAG